MSVRFRTTILQTGKAATFEIPPAPVESLAAGSIAALREGRVR